VADGDPSQQHDTGNVERGSKPKRTGGRHVCGFAHVRSHRSRKYSSNPQRHVQRNGNSAHAQAEPRRIHFHLSNWWHSARVAESISQHERCGVRLCRENVSNVADRHSNQRDDRRNRQCVNQSCRSRGGKLQRKCDHHGAWSRKQSADGGRHAQRDTATEPDRDSHSPSIFLPDRGKRSSDAKRVGGLER
jgi:hypothetical protein